MLKFFKNIKIFNIFLLIISLTFILVIIVLFRQQKQSNELNSEFVFSPQSEPISSPKNQNYIETLNSINIDYLHKLIYNWQIFFDYFALNPQLQVFRANITYNALENLKTKVSKSQQEFFKGSSDEILKEFGEVLKEECNYYKLDYRLVLAIMKQESAFTSTAISRAGAYGFMQIMPKTGSSLENTLQIEDYKSPKNNLIAGIYYYALLVGRYDGVGEDKYKFALAAYNCGAGRVEDAMTIVYYLKNDYKKWENVKEALKLLGPDNDSLHANIWNSERPTNGYFTNWQEPINYVSNVIYYWQEYKRIYKKPKL